MNGRILQMDGFLASIMAAESIGGSVTVLHGPGGCRAYSARMSARTVLRDFHIREGPFYFDQPRVPCTYVDDEDYINGADYKVTEALDTVDADLCVIIPTPGTSLIGDDLHGAVYRSSFEGMTVILETSFMSELAHRGYDSTVAAVVSEVCRPVPGDQDGVVLLGIPVTLEGWESTVSEFRGYLEAMGLRVLACAGCGSDVSEMMRSAGAAYCVSVMPEYCGDTMEAYRRLGVEPITPPVPVGFRATGDWIRAVAEGTGRDPGAALGMLGSSVDRSRTVLRSALQEGMSARFATYSVAMDSRIVAELIEWLHAYLLMTPRAVSVSDCWDPEYKGRLERTLEGIGCADALTRDPSSTVVDVCFSNGLTAGLLERKHTCSVGVDMELPSRHRLIFVDRPVLGARGALRILDELFFGIERRNLNVPGGSTIHIDGTRAHDAHRTIPWTSW